MYFAQPIIPAVLLLAAVASAVPSYPIVTVVDEDANSFYKPLSEVDAARLAAWKSEDGDMWQYSGQFEGDMVLQPGQRNGLIDVNKRWPNEEIPYAFALNHFTQQQMRDIADSLTRAYTGTCITVRPRINTDVDYVVITSYDTGCHSAVGYQGRGQQTVNLQTPGCLRYGTIAHEFLHSAGFYHQQSALTRDCYVSVKWQNIPEDKWHNFYKYSDQVITDFGEDYDFGSIMHYGRTAFSNNTRDTIVPHDPNVSIGQRVDLSNIDLNKLDKMYGCLPWKFEEPL